MSSPSMNKKGFTRVMVAVDGSDVSLRAAGHAARIARQDGAELFAVQVVPVPPFEAPGELAAHYAHARKTAKKWMGAGDEIATRNGIAVKTEVIVGAYSVVEAILGYAETVK